MPVKGNFDIANMMQQLQYEDVEFYKNKLDKRSMKLNEFYQLTTGAVANQTQEAKITLDTKRSVLEAVKKEHLAISQVSVDEEMVNLIKFQGGYAANAKVYNEQLDRLDKDFLDMVAYAPRKTILVGDRFPFRYLAARYGLHYYAAFPGCSAQTRPSAATLAFLVKKTRGEKLPIIFRVAGSSSRIAQAIAEPAGSKVLVLHALHNLSPDEMRRGETYLTLMRANLNALKTALYA